MIEPERIQFLNNLPPDPKGRFVLYWMQQSQRACFNHALEYAIWEANESNLPVLVGFGLTDDYPKANERHYAFMLEGLDEVARSLENRGIRLVVRRGRPDLAALALAEAAAFVVCDRGYLRHQREWRQNVAEKAGKLVVQVEGDLVIPVEAASGKQETGARTIRPKLVKRMDEFIHSLPRTDPGKSSFDLDISGDLDPMKPGDNLKLISIDRSTKQVSLFKGGEIQAKKRLRDFITTRLEGYKEKRNDPALDHTSRLGPYLHFGHISPVEVALAVRQAHEGSPEDNATFLEELIVRRELCANYVFYQPQYDRYDAIPAWAGKSLKEHRYDLRPYLYGQEDLESARTHDPYWNAAMKEMVHTGYMHNYMRMYWGKKILEWTETPEQAFRTILTLNDKYFLDGRDMNSYANVGWIFGLHDRPWPEREIFGKVRYMNANGLKRKFDIDGYVARIEKLAAPQNFAGLSGKG